MCCARARRGNHSGKQKNELLTDLPERLRGFTATDVRLSVFRESLGASASNGFRDFEACVQPMLGILHRCAQVTPPIITARIVPPTHSTFTATQM